MELNFLNLQNGNLKIVLAVIFIVVTYTFLNIFIKTIFLKKVRTKKMRHNVIVFTSLISYTFIFIAVLFIAITLAGGLTGLGIAAGLLTAALGWALQRPITGIAAWIMVITTKPFEIGDRIIVGGVRGDVINITLTHIYLGEFGGTIGGEEISGRTVIIPNAVLFEQNVINYTSENDYILDEVAFTITYKSHLDLAKKIAKEAANKVTKDFVDRVPMKPFIRINFQPSGVDVRIRYYTGASERQEINSKITEEIFKNMMKEKKIDFAFPHTQVVLDKRYSQK
ncbi:MAG: mechanosensitive ion channel family protein [Nanoarchaeota archaeon]|nr:mechanosensitive ion channel family protein [Nanoarchaeota archaeon]MBU1501495.1 mechanosensitive ion channel family protein [Nanoarchaeota archaeon]MBU2459111.1 mechanosensitive ion channel family protein [Nanoarchaeota archaeon]